MSIGDFEEVCESTNLSRENISRQVGRTNISEWGSWGVVQFAPRPRVDKMGERFKWVTLEGG